MQEIVKINNNDLPIKEWNGKRVVTFKDIDRVHQRADGTAHRNFKENKAHLIENEDFFILKPSDIQMDEFRPLGFENDKPANRGTTYLTANGYLTLVKSFTDDLAWKIQRDLVNTYFEFQEVVQDFNANYPIDTNALNLFLAEMKENLPCVYAQINNIEQTLEKVVDNMTLSTRQQERIHEVARKRINFLLGGAHGVRYKKFARSYMINLWNDLKETFQCGSSYKDLRPQEFDHAVNYIENWTHNGI